MVKLTIMDLLNKGLYSPSEAAYYGEISFGSVYRWLYRTKRTKPILRPEVQAAQKIVTFLDFIQLYIVSRAKAKGVSIQKIRKAIDRAERNGFNHPLARRDVVVVFDREIHTGDSDDNLEQFTGEFQGQMLLREIAEPYLDRIEWNEEGWAKRFRLFEAYGRAIWMDPRFEFGTPIVGTTGTPFYVLANAATAEGSIPNAAEIYGVDESDVLAALALYDRLEKAA